MHVFTTYIAACLPDIQVESSTGTIHRECLVYPTQSELLRSEERRNSCARPNDKDGPIGTSDCRRKDPRRLHPSDGSSGATNQDGHTIMMVIATLDELDNIHHDGHRYVWRIR